jgi:hypothetical protein
MLGVASVDAAAHRRHLPAVLRARTYTPAAHVIAIAEHACTEQLITVGVRTQQASVATAAHPTQSVTTSNCSNAASERGNSRAPEAERDSKLPLARRKRVGASRAADRSLHGATDDRCWSSAASARGSKQLHRQESLATSTALERRKPSWVSSRAQDRGEVPSERVPESTQQSAFIGLRA